MLVREYMTPNPITITPNMSVPDALHLMRERKIHRLPVVDAHGNLVGIVSDKDLLHASPSPATTLAVWEMPELLARLKVEKVMSREVITVPEETPLEEAARIMADQSIGGLPVMQGQTMVGIITETDLFKVLLQLLGGRRPGVRIAVSVPGAKGTLAKITNSIFGVGGNIVGLGVSEVGEGNDMRWEMMVKVQDVSRDRLVEALRPVVDDILNVGETDASEDK
jgi:acetoin utilization protein AcuB